MKTPQAVKDEAKFLTDEYPATYNHLGVYDEYEVYTLNFKGEPPLIGFPWVFLYKEGEDVVSMNDPRFVFNIIDEALRYSRARRKAARLARMNNGQ